METKKRKILLYSRLALYPMHWEAFKLLCKTHNLDATIITTYYSDLPEGHRMLGAVDPETEKTLGFAPKIYYLHQTNSIAKIILIFKYLQEIGPDLVWAQEECLNPFIIPLLSFYFFKKDPLIVAAVTENIFPLTGMRKFFYNTI